MNNQTTTQIQVMLQGMEMANIGKQDQLVILYAVEAGSRMWGFPSVDSDYDVRFVYVRRPEWYLQLGDRRDTIEIPVEDGLDFSGWDLDKTLRLFKKGNPPLLEWLRTDLVYIEDQRFTLKLGALIPDYLDKNAMAYHYLHMAQNNWARYLQGDEIWTKKYFYVLRPLLSVIWMEDKTNHAPGVAVAPPLEFERLLDETVEADNVRAEIDDLLARKVAGEELDHGPVIPLLHTFIGVNLGELLERRFEHEPPEKSWAKLDALFIEMLNNIWGYEKSK